MRVHQPKISFVETTEGIVDLRTTSADGLYFGALEFDTRFEALLDRVIAQRLAGVREEGKTKAATRKR
jgi:hypothetical protein